MTARSWKISRPSVTCPCGDAVSPRSPSSLSTIAVDDSDTRNPVNSAARQSTPSAASAPSDAEAGQRHLQPAAAEDQRLDAPQLLEAELDADGEQQQDDADFRGVVDERRIVDQPATRADR